MQGREKEAVIISLVRSNDKVQQLVSHLLPSNDHSQREVGFLKDERRLNGIIKTVLPFGPLAHLLP